METIVVEKILVETSADTERQSEIEREKEYGTRLPLQRILFISLDSSI